MTEQEKIKYAMWLSRVLLLRSGAIKQSCIASAKITTEVLRSLGIAARPMCASVMAATKPFMDRLERGEKPVPENTEPWWEEDRSYSIGVMYDPEPNPGSFTGHMIVLAGAGHRWLVDPSIDQISRPQRDLAIEPVMVDLHQEQRFDQREFRLGRTQAITGWIDEDTDKQFIIVWSCFPADRSFRKLNDFTMFEYRYGEMTRGIVDVIKELDEDGVTGDALPPLPPLPDAPDGPGLAARVKTDEERARVRMTAHGG
jgi:hypothetical protein